MLPLLPQAALTSVALGQLDQLKALPGGAQGLLDLIKDCPIMAEVSSSTGVRPRPEDAWQALNSVYSMLLESSQGNRCTRVAVLVN